MTTKAPAPSQALMLDNSIEQLCMKYGFKAVLAGLCRYANRNIKNPVIFRRLNKIYKWLTEYDA